MSCPNWAYPPPLPDFARITDLSPNDIDVSADDICNSPVPALSSKVCVVIDNEPPSYLIEFIESPKWNSGSVLLFANQNPAVVEPTSVLPL